MTIFTYVTITHEGVCAHKTIMFCYVVMCGGGCSTMYIMGVGVIYGCGVVMYLGDI